ncbi:MAG: acyclic terpene utilization AtuA family protein, partial [Pseudomonadota bacterium]
MGQDRLIIGGASGYWGEAPHATAQLLAHPGLNVLVYDYLAEITMSLLARARSKDPAMGYAPDFVSAAMAPNLETIAGQGVKVVSNAGGLNPATCADALRAEIAKQGLSLKVGVVTGDDLSPRAKDFANAEEMFSGEAFPTGKLVASVNAYLGAFPVAAALDAGADIVVTGRIVDSAATLGACIHHFGWGAGDLDRLAGGSLAGHILECGPQATGGNFTDWEEAGDIADIGYPIAEVGA